MSGAILTSEKVHFKTRGVIGENFIIIKTKSKRIKVSINKCIIIVGSFNISLSIVDGISIYIEHR